MNYSVLYSKRWLWFHNKFNCLVKELHCKCVEHWELYVLLLLHEDWTCLSEYDLIIWYTGFIFTCTRVHLHHTFDMYRLTDLRATGNLLNRNSKTFSKGRRTKEPSDPESTLRLASKDKCVIMHRSLCDTDRDGSVLRYRPGDEERETGLSVIALHKSPYNNVGLSI